MQLVYHLGCVAGVKITKFYTLNMIGELYVN